MNESDTSLANKTGHFNLLTTGASYNSQKRLRYEMLACASHTKVIAQYGSPGGL